MKKIALYIGLLLSGLILGWILFDKNEPSSNSENPHVHTNESGEIWTCSMHPQVQQPEPGDCPICGMDLIPLKDGANKNPREFIMSDDAVKIANIQTTEIGTVGSSNEQFTVSGRIKSDETTAASIVTHVSGRIEKLYVSYSGQQISQGQKVALIYSPKLIAAQKELIEANKVKDVSPTVYEASYNKLKNWKLSDEQIVSILESEELIETFAIYAQFSGVITVKRIAVGDYLNEGEVLFDIQSLSSVWAVFDVYETDITNLDVGDEVRFTTATYPDEEFSAKINFIDPLIDPDTRTVSVRANVSNAELKLKPNMFIEGTIDNTETGKSLLTVPKSAVLWTGKRSVVYVKLPNQSIPTFEHRNVEIGEVNGNAYQVISGLNEGDEVVTNGAFVIDASAQLNNQYSMMNQDLVSQVDERKSVNNTNLTQDVHPKFKAQFNRVLKGYLALKIGLVNDNPDQAKQAAGIVLNALKNVDMKLVKRDAHIRWMELQETIQASAKKINLTSDIGAQRSAFISLSDALITTFKTFGTTEKIYEQFCPMANNGEGAKWLSTEEKIKNPYFGDQMLGCGSTLDTIEL